jgi:hypothetical protein
MAAAQPHPTTLATSSLVRRKLAMTQQCQYSFLGFC